MEKLPVSAIILARNEASHIVRAVESVAFAREILVIDGGSTDATMELARDAGARVLERRWTGFRDQRNFSLESAREQWVFVLDADEAASPELEKWLRQFFASDAVGIRPIGYKIHRVEYFLGREIHGTCWNPSYQDRFFQKDRSRYVGEIHEYPDGAPSFARAPEEAVIRHNPRVTVESFLEKMNRYTTIEAWDRYKKGERTNLLHIGVAFFATWWKNFFYYGGYRDGAYGFLICVLEGISRTVRHVKLWQIQTLSADGRAEYLVPADQALKAGAALHRTLESERPQP